MKAEEAENSTYYKLFVSKSNRRVAVGGDFDRQRASEVAWVRGLRVNDPRRQSLSPLNSRQGELEADDLQGRRGGGGGGGGGRRRGTFLGVREHRPQHLWQGESQDPKISGENTHGKKKLRECRLLGQKFWLPLDVEGEFTQPRICLFLMCMYCMYLTQLKLTMTS